MTRLIVTTDVHGCVKELEQLLAKVDFNKSTDKLYHLGDAMNRGPDSAGVIRVLRENDATMIMGNHDDSHVRYAKHLAIKETKPKYNIPMRMSYHKLLDHATLTPDMLAWLASLPVYLTLPNGWVVVHAGFEPNKPLEEQDKSKLTHLRYLDKDTLKPVPLGPDFTEPPNSVYWTEAYNLPHNVMYGHMVHSLTSPRVVTNKEGYSCIGLDTGACYGGSLNCAVFDDCLPDTKPRFVQVKAEREYVKLTHLI